MEVLIKTLNEINGDFKKFIKLMIECFNIEMLQTVEKSDEDLRHRNTMHNMQNFKLVLELETRGECP